MKSGKRNLLSLVSLVVLVALLLGACAPAAPLVVEKAVLQTVVVEKEVPVEKQVVQTVVVEKVVEVTAVPGQEKPKTGGILKFGQAQPSSTINPWAGAMMAVTDANIVNQIYEGLLWMDSGYNVMPSLAESWDISDDGLVYTFNIRQGVQFHNGQPLTAADVVYSVEQTMRPEVSAYATQLSMIAGVEALDDATVQITLKEPYSPFLTVLARPNIYITPAGSVEESPFQYIGTGPFMLKEWDPGAKTELVRNDNYWEEGLPYLDGISMAYLTDDAARVANLTAGAVDFIMMVPGASWDQLAADPTYKLYTGDTGIFFMFTFNIGEAPFNDPNVLKALQWIPDKKVMCNVYTSGRCNRWFMGDPQPPNSGLYTGYEEFTGPDLEKAAEYLAQSNYPDGFEAELNFYGPASDEGQIAEIMQINASKLGIRFNVTALDNAVWREKIYKGEFQAALQGLRAIGPDEIFYGIMHPEGSLHGFAPNYDYTEYNALVEKARGVSDEAERQALYAEAINMGYEGGWPLVYLFTYDDRMGMRSDVMGYEVDGLGTAKFLKRVWLNR